MLSLSPNPFESPCCNQAQDQQVVSAKAGGVFPCVSVFVGALKGDVEEGAFVGLLTPDARADEAVADFVDGLVIRRTGRGLISHVFSFWFIGLMVMRESS